MKRICSLLLSAFTFLNVYAQDINFSLQHDGKTRTFIFHSPCATFDCTNKKIPLVFAFHGLTESGAATQTYSRFNELADTAGFAVIYANGINNTWNVGFGGTAASSEDDLGFANAMIDFVIDSSNCQTGTCVEIDTNRIFSCGMSNGGFFSYLLACQLSHRIAAVASVTGSMTIPTYDACNPTRAVPVLHIHGTADPIVPYTGGDFKTVDEVMAYWTNHNNCTGTPTTTSLPDIATNDGSTVETIHYNSCDNNAEVLHYKITGGGHTWTGMQNPYPEFIVGKNNRDIFASQEIWLFFKQHSLDGSITGMAERNNMLDNPFKIFPNPVADILNIESETNAIITIADISGKTLLHSNAVAGNNQLNIASLPSGIYVGTIQQQQSYYRFKVVKE